MLFLAPFISLLVFTKQEKSWEVLGDPPSAIAPLAFGHSFFFLFFKQEKDREIYTDRYVKGRD